MCLNQPESGSERMNHMNVKDNMQNFAINQALKYIEGNPEENIPKLMSLVDRFTPEGWYQSQRDAIRQAIEEKNNWYQLILRIYELDPGVRRAFFQNFLFNASLKGSATQEEVKTRENCNVPWAILLDPTSACNMHCTGCWAAEYAGRDWQSGMYIRSGTISAKHFYDLQKAGNYASASQITPIQYFQSFEPALSAETTFVSVFSSGMSRTFQSAQVCAEELREDAFLQKGVLSFIL